MRNRVRFVLAATVAISLGLTFLQALNAFSFYLFLIVAFLILVVLAELTAPTVIYVNWGRPLYLLLALGLVVSLGILGQRVLETLPDGILPL